jgi:hypothetical protein
MLTRARLNLQLAVRPWFLLFGEWHDSRAPGYGRPLSGSMADRFDLRQAYVQAGANEGNGWSVRIGRQALKYGRGRLVWDPDWGNFGRVFDGVRIALAGQGARLDAFAASVVSPQDRLLDRSNASSMLYGLYGSIDRWASAFQIEPYLLLKSDGLARGGPLDLYTAGFRALGSWLRVDWETELAVQSGRLAGNAVRAFGGVWSAGFRTGNPKYHPRIILSYTYGSGDPSPADGTRSTFDTLYPSVHMRNGATDRIGWANVHDWAVESEWTISRRLKISTGGHEFRLATVNDSLYAPSGSPLMRNPLATSARLGSEVFANAAYQLSRSLSSGVGYAHLFRGPYLRQSGRSSATQPYAFLAYRF